MLLTLFLVFVVAPVIELGVFLEVAGWIGVWPAILLLLGFSALGAWLIRRAGVSAWRRSSELFRRGEIPTAEVGDGLLTMFAGVMLLLPGFLTDALALVLLLPPVRRFARNRFVKRWMVGRRMPGFVRSRSIVDIEWVGDVTPRRGPSSAPIEIGPGRVADRD